MSSFYLIVKRGETSLRLGYSAQQVHIIIIIIIIWVYGYSFLCLVGCFSMIIWTPTVLSVLYACVLYFCICTCSAQLSMFHMERGSRNTLIIIIIIIIKSGCLIILGVPTVN